MILANIKWAGKEQQMRTISIAILSVLLLLSGCTSGSAGSGSDSSAIASDEDQSGQSALEQYSAETETLALGFPLSYTPNELYALSLALAAAQDIYGISDTEAASVLDIHFTESELRGLLDELLLDGMSLAELSSRLTGSYSDPVEQIVLGLDFEEELPADSPIESAGTPTIVPGVDGGNALEFDAPGEYIRLPADDSNDLSGESSTIELWIQPKTNKTGAGIIHKGTASDWSDEAYSLQYNSPGELAFIITNEGGTHTYAVSTAPKLAVDTWYHIVVTWNQTQFWMYVNGEDVAKKYIQYKNNAWTAWTTALPEDFAPMRSSEGDLMIGTQLPDSEPEYRFEGVIDKIKLYDRVLDETEVFDHYTNP
jgi:Concanavalin A-like lectin/glucanases superfamily